MQSVASGVMGSSFGEHTSREVAHAFNSAFQGYFVLMSSRHKPTSGACGERVSILARATSLAGRVSPPT
jgi:hypothetical protein